MIIANKLAGIAWAVLHDGRNFEVAAFLVCAILLEQMVKGRSPRMTLDTIAPLSDDPIAGQFDLPSRASTAMPTVSSTSRDTIRAMVSLQYKGRINKSKFTMRSLRYIVWDQAARRFPYLQRRWLFPVESQPIGDAAFGDVPLPSAVMEATLPELFASLGISAPARLQLTDHIYALRDVLVTGWGGAIMKDGLLLTIRPQHNWVASVRADRQFVRMLADDRPYFSLLASIQAKVHVFHWLFDAVAPLLAYLESGQCPPDLGLIVNAAESEMQRRSLDYLKDRYGLSAIAPVGPHETVRVPHLEAAIPVPHVPRALQSPLALARLEDLGSFIAEKAEEERPRRIYISRNDARLRRVLNEKSLLPTLEALGFERVVLDGLPIARQVTLFRQAEIVVAPHGAGLAHIAWCKPGTKIIEFFPSPYGPRGRVRNATYDYWLLSQQLSLDYSCALAGPVETRNDGFRIGRDLLTRTIEEAIARLKVETAPAYCVSSVPIRISIGTYEA